jgi:hypothetical protein
VEPAPGCPSFRFISSPSRAPTPLHFGQRGTHQAAQKGAQAARAQTAKLQPQNNTLNVSESSNPHPQEASFLGIITLKTRFRGCIFLDLVGLGPRNSPLAVYQTQCSEASASPQSRRRATAPSLRKFSSKTITTSTTTTPRRHDDNAARRRSNKVR